MKTNGNKDGFSMIEVLVAATIMVVIVMMLAMLFQQTSLAWRTGVKRAEGYMQIRAVLGAIQRDAAAAVDLPDSVRTKFGGGAQKFDGELSFYTLTGTVDKKGEVVRALKYITYDSSGMRTESVLKPKDTQFSQDASYNVKDVFERIGNPNAATVGSFTFTPYPTFGFPLYVAVDSEVTTYGYSLDVGAWSAGPDKVFGTSPDDPNGKDDIKTWTDK